MMNIALQPFLNGRYVFHGTNNGGITEFEPRQALSSGQPDGEPAVFASGDAAPAIFMAIFGSRKTGGMGMSAQPGYGFYIWDKNWREAMTEKWYGYVYVLPKDSFEPRGSSEWRSFVGVKPVARIPVSFDDLPANILIMNENDFFTYLDSLKA